MPYSTIPEGNWNDLFRGILVYLAMELDKDSGATICLECSCLRCNWAYSGHYRSPLEFTNAFLANCRGGTVRSVVAVGRMDNLSEVFRFVNDGLEATSGLGFPNGVGLLEIGQTIHSSGISTPLELRRFVSRGCAVCG